jgi:hypothetical protein
MPLFANALALIRHNLEEVGQGRRARLIVIGNFTEDQYKAINQVRNAIGLFPLENNEIVFFGAHLYKSRVIKDGYTVDDVMLQIKHAMAATSEVRANTWMTTIKSTVRRKDGYGSEVLDEAVFEMTSRKPKAELFSVAPKGDRMTPNQIRSAA